MSATPDTLTEVVRQWAERLGQPAGTAERLLAERDAETLRRAAGLLTQDSKDPYLSNAQRGGLEHAAMRLRDLAKSITGAVQPGGRRPATAVPRTASGHLFTPGERRVIAELARGGELGDVAGRLSLATNTVKTHLRRMKKRAGATSSSHLVALAIAHGAIPVDAALGEDGDRR